MAGKLWTDAEIDTLVEARNSGMSWEQIVDTHFPDRTWSACKWNFNSLRRDAPDADVVRRTHDLQPTREEAELSCARLLAAQIAADQICPVPMAAWIARHGQPVMAA